VWVSERVTLQHTATYLSTSTTGHGDDICEDTATHYTSLQYTAAHCNIFEHLHNGPQRRHLRGYCNILHYTTTHCNMLQHTATYLSTFTTGHSEDTCVEHPAHMNHKSLKKIKMLQCVAVRSVLQLQDAMCHNCSL